LIRHATCISCRPLGEMTSGELMKLISVRSSSIRRVGYEVDQRILYVQFIDGDLYEYFDVPVGDFIDLLHAESIGWFVNKRIKPYYDYRKLEAVS
jgi:hypothetical protein